MSNTSQNPSSSAQQRSNTRYEKHTKTHGNKGDLTVRQALFEKLLHGYKTVNEVMSGMHISTNYRAIHLPVSTRAIGFTVRVLVKKFASIGINNIDFHQLCSAMYRIHLLMYEIKMINARSAASYRNAPHGFVEFEIDTNIVRIVNSLASGFSPLTNLISSIGVLHAFNTTFIPRHPIATSIDMVHQIEPSMITYSNLRDTVVALANPATNRATRLWFYEHSPLPNARWNVRRRRDHDGNLVANNDFPILQNPDDIIPGVYGSPQIRADVDTIANALDIIGRKYPKYINIGRIDFANGGDYSMLVSNEQNDLRCADLNWIMVQGNNVPDYQATPALEGEDQDFWSIDKLSDTEFYMGVLHLLGELPQNPPEIFSIRSKTASKMDANHTYSDAIANMIG